MKNESARENERDGEASRLHFWMWGDACCTSSALVKALREKKREQELKKRGGYRE